MTDMMSNQQHFAKTSDQFVAVRRSRTLHLPAILDSAFAPTLVDILKACEGEDVTIDASYVQQTSPACAQVLRAAQDAWETGRHLMTFVNAPSALTDLLSNVAREALAA
jgi:anti-anti-sigma regulatory factor